MASGEASTRPVATDDFRKLRRETFEDIFKLRGWGPQGRVPWQKHQVLKLRDRRMSVPRPFPEFLMTACADCRKTAAERLNLQIASKS
jgi:hypothetical protein